jgi:aspartyl-tRNA(Asn)/glutamyl-tRNA(Gln) amidotransferase subunit C
MQKIEELAAIEKLTLSDEEKAFMEAKIKILEESFAALKQIDTKGIEPLISVMDMQNVLRDDVACKMLSRAELLANAPEQDDGYFQVPKTLG